MISLKSIDSPFDFALLLDMLIKEYNANIPDNTIKLVEQYGKDCFKMGFDAGKLPANHPKYSIASK